MLGRHYLIGQLVKDEVHVALPLWDQGVDLIAYYVGSRGLVSRALQLKVASNTRWSLDIKYADIAGLLMVYIWNVGKAPDDIEIYAMNYTEAEALLKTGSNRDFSRSPTWEKEGRYSIAHLEKDTNKLRQSMQKYRMGIGLWKKKLEES